MPSTTMSIKTHDEVLKPMEYGYPAKMDGSISIFSDSDETYNFKRIELTKQLVNQFEHMNNQTAIDYILKYGRPERMNLHSPHQTFNAYSITNRFKNQAQNLSTKQRQAVINVYIYSKTGFNPKTIPEVWQTIDPR